MSEERNIEPEEAIENLEKELRLSINIDSITTEVRNEYVKIILNYIDKLQKDNKRKIKIIDLLIDDFQLEGYLQFESKDDVLSYYNRRINLEEGNE